MRMGRVFVRDTDACLVVKRFLILRCGQRRCELPALPYYPCESTEMPSSQAELIGVNRMPSQWSAGKLIGRSPAPPLEQRDLESMGLRQRRDRRLSTWMCNRQRSSGPPHPDACSEIKSDR